MNTNCRFPKLLFLFLLFCRTASAFSLDTPQRPKIGLVLSGGGAKGFAHIGTLKMLDSLNIPVDCIAGTSMGGILGALYAIGYSGLDLEKFVDRDDWEEIFTDIPPRPTLPFFQKEQVGRYQLEFGLKGLKPVPPSGLIFGQKISLLFSSLTFPFERIADFDRLPIPFRCVAVDLVTGNEVVLKNGSLAKAMRAIMAIPTVFSPLEWGDSLLVDGGMVNNLPVDVVQAMGADVVIAVDVGSPLKERRHLASGLSVLEQTVTIVGLDRIKKNAQKADILIRPDIQGFSAGDFDRDKIRVICQRGGMAAHQSLSQLLELKEKYQLQRTTSLTEFFSAAKPPRIFDVQVTAHQSIPFEFIHSHINFKPDEVFDPLLLQTRIAELRATGRFESIEHEVVSMPDDYVRLFIRVKEKQMPSIDGISIVGNEQLPFLFIYHLLGLRPGDPLDTDALNRRIMEMYGLGYFEVIHYEIAPAGEQRVQLTLRVKELPLRKLRIGLRYDDRHKLVAAVSMQATNLPFPGLRLENELQFAGLTRLRFKASYPSRALNFPVYPFLRLEYRDISTNIFDDRGNRIADYKDRSTSFAGGLGLLFGKSIDAEIEYQHEDMDIEPNVAFPDPTMFPSWDDRLRKVQATMTIDLLDSVLLPRRGILVKARYEGSLRQLHSAVPYQQVQISADWYHTLQRRHTTRLYGFSGRSWDNLPIYKFLMQGRPETFVGLDYDRLFASRLSVLRFEYRYEHRKDIFLKFIINGAFDIEYRGPAEATFETPTLWGMGVGLTLVSPVGPIDIVYSRGDKTFAGPRAKQAKWYFTLGYKF